MNEEKLTTWGLTESDIPKAILVRVFFGGDKAYVIDAKNREEAEKLALERFNNEHDLQPYIEDVWVGKGQEASQPPALTETKGEQPYNNYIPEGE